MKIGQLLTEIPTSIDNFYEKILRDPLGAGQNSTLIHETFHKDWQSRPNCMNPYGKGIFSPNFFREFFKLKYFFPVKLHN